jgi:hypothetical protein
MIQTTPNGHRRILKAVTDTLKTLHLYVFEGEVSGYGYAARALRPELWEAGVYPDQLWEFDAEDDSARVLGYYVTDVEGHVIFSEEFPIQGEEAEPGFVIGRQGDRIVVGLRLNLMVASSDGQ